MFSKVRFLVANMEENLSSTPSPEGSGSDDHPWSFLTAKFCELLNPGQPNLNFVWVMCKPKKNTVKASVNSTWNLKSHTKRIHPHSCDELEKLFAKNQRLKRKSTGDCLGNLPKKQATLDTFVNHPSKSPHTQGLGSSFITQSSLNTEQEVFLVVSD